jgi:hypothetical protein
MSAEIVSSSIQALNPPGLGAAIASKAPEPGIAHAVSPASPGAALAMNAGPSGGAALAAPASSGQWRALVPVEEARRCVNRAAFAVAHSLTGNPLFALDALIGVAKEAAKRPGDLYLDAGDVSVMDKWGHIPIPDRPVEEIIHRIESAGAWIIIKHVEQTPGYAEVIQEFNDFVRQLAGPETARLLSHPEMLVLVTSPKRITPFHFDAEVNFLIQVQGEKEAWICDPSDRTAVTHEEIERYYSVNHNAGTYKPGVEARARKFHLRPGYGVHIPTHAAHWVSNGSGVSVSLSLNFELPPGMYRDIYRMNHKLRRLGIEPRPPGESVLGDRLKAAAAAVGRRWSGLRGRS